MCQAKLAPKERKKAVKVPQALRSDFSHHSLFGSSGMDSKCKWKLLITIIAMMLVACAPIPTPTVLEDVPTADLLVKDSLLFEVWRSEHGVEEDSCHAVDFWNCVEVNVVEFRKPTASANHTIARFESLKDAARTFNNHDFTGNTKGRNPRRWEPVNVFSYSNPLADQYNIVCNVNSPVTSCVIEARYGQYFSILLFSSLEWPELALDDLETWAKAIDQQFSEVLFEQRE